MDDLTLENDVTVSGDDDGTTFEFCCNVDGISLNSSDELLLLGWLAAKRGYKVSKKKD